MAPDLATAKRAVKAKKPSDPELSSAMDEAKKEALSLNERIARDFHLRKMESINQGWLGVILGSPANKPGNIAFIVIILCFIAVLILFNKIDLENHPDAFLKIAPLFISIISGALGYLFGSARKR